ncbi:LexA repressor, partial [Candidatus Endoriftia persephone str. Guaymas]|nr:LexA repressor [Candidatus Endoriftia persephone str. Guaymas]
MATQRAGVIGTLVFGVICALAGYFAAFEWGKPILDKAEASVNWPQVAGRIEIAELQQARDSDGNRLYRAQIDY